MRCGWMMGVENNLDWCHAAFSHPWAHPQWFQRRLRGISEHEYQLRQAGDSVIVSWPPDDQSDPMTRPRVRLTFDPPERVIVEQRWIFTVRIIMHFVPTGDGSCRLEWLWSKLLPIGPHFRWSRHEPLVFRQDRILLESAQPWYASTEGSFEKSVPADASTLLARRVVRAAGVGTDRPVDSDCTRLVRVRS
jgi:Vanillate O-demethylase oxygenase C-terminal domain